MNKGEQGRREKEDDKNRNRKIKMKRTLKERNENNNNEFNRKLMNEGERIMMIIMKRR